MEHEPPIRILVVDDDVLVAESLGAFLRREGHVVETSSNGDDALRRLDDEESFAVLITDLSMPGMDGIELIRRARAVDPAVVPLVVTGFGTIESAVEAVRLGAIDYLTKPLVDEELRVALAKALQQHALRAENAKLRRRIDARQALEGVVGVDPRMRRLFEVVEAVAASRTTVLMCGESGTGKSLVARAIHRSGPRATRPFVEIACGSIPETLLESELFGHVKGAFTGAHTDKAGKFLAANGGTIFLDEINSAPPAMQLKLLRVLQERKFEPVGSNETIEVDVRVLLAANEPLDRLVREGRFRQDLYYRINVISVDLPPLRERSLDIPMLAEHFLAAKCEQEGRTILGFDDDAMDALRRYGWPGNVRELENVIERAVVLAHGARIAADDLPPGVAGRAEKPALVAAAGTASRPADPEPWTPMPLRQALEDPERRIILATLAHCDWNRQKTAEVLGINRATLYKKMRALGI